MKLGINSVIFENKHDAQNADMTKNIGSQKNDSSNLFEENNTVDHFLKNDSIVKGRSKFDKFFDETEGQRDLHDAFDSFDEVVFIDDETRVNLDQLDEELASQERLK